MFFLRQWAWLLLLILFSFTAFYSSGIDNGTSHDKLKYLSITWSMMQSHQYLIPMVNGVPYTDKPPLFFWLIASVWHLFGANMFGLQCFIDIIIISWALIMRALYAIVFPNDRLGKELIPYLLIGSHPIWSNIWFLRVDLLLLTGILLCNLGIFRCIVSASPHSKSLYSSFVSLLFIAAGCCIGLFAKGPIVYVFTLLPFLVSAIFTKNYRPYLLKIVGAIFIGTLIVLVTWVIPAILSMDQTYAQQILYRQISHRAVYTTQHPFLQKSYFVYIYQYIPMLFFPWIINCIFINKFRSTFQQASPCRSFILSIFIISIIIFSFFGQKSVWYVLPILPFGLIFFTRFFVENKDQRAVVRLNRIVLSVMFGCFGILSIGLLLSPTIQAHIFNNFGGYFSLSPGVMLSLAAISFITLAYLCFSKNNLLRLISVSSIMLLVVYSLSNLYFFPFEKKYTKINEVAAYLHAQELNKRGIVLYKSDYLGQFTYVGQLQEVISRLNKPDELENWLKKYPQGIVLYSGENCPPIENISLLITYHESARAMPILLCQR